ncbi:DUF397 domain-containing protein [Streptomyces sp. 5K101]|uniref:DUF397 domain-containing protein n=1 Tax=Streptomyces sp. 5K101 TaxID=3390037 RepID=UPI0039752873
MCVGTAAQLEVRDVRAPVLLVHAIAAPADFFGRSPDDRTGVRDSKVTDGPGAAVPTSQWTAFVRYLKAS